MDASFVAHVQCPVDRLSGNWTHYECVFVSVDLSLAATHERFLIDNVIQASFRVARYSSGVGTTGRWCLPLPNS